MVKKKEIKTKNLPAVASAKEGAQGSLEAKAGKRILGIDPGYAITGWAVLEKNKNNLRLFKCDCITTPPEIQHAERLKILNSELKKIIKKYKPDILAIEDLFFFKNLKTAIKVAEAKGVVLMTAIKAGLEIQEFTPLQVKQALVGYGRADKKQIQAMVKVILGLSNIPQPDDAADAVAVCITCAHSIKSNRVIQQ